LFFQKRFSERFGNAPLAILLSVRRGNTRQRQEDDNPMTTASAHDHSRTFILRLWLEAGAGNRNEWRGQLQPIPDGQSRYFRDWSTLARLLEVPPAAVEQEVAHE
jgi:hypothetical protein